MSKEKFEIAFMAGGLLLNVLTSQLRRAPRTAPEQIGAATHELSRCLTERRDQIADPAEVEASVRLLREALCADRPDRVVLTAHLHAIGSMVRHDQILAEAATRLDDAVTAWLG